MKNRDYFIQEYKINLNVRTADQIYMGSVFITFSNIPESMHIILNCDEKLLITAVKNKGKEIPYSYNQYSHTLHISCQVENDNIYPPSDETNNNTQANGSDITCNNSNTNNNLDVQNNPKEPKTTKYIVCVQFQSQINPDHQGFFYVDDATAAIHLFPNFSYLFVPCDTFTGESSDINNQGKTELSSKFSFKFTDISVTITAGESPQVAVCSIPSPQAINFINNRMMFKFGKLKIPLPYFSAAIGEFQKYEIEINPKNDTNSEHNTKIHFFFDSYIEEQYYESIISFFGKAITIIEKLFNLKPFSNCIQIADNLNYPEDQSNTAGLIIFTPETLVAFDQNKHLLIKQILKQYINIFPATVNENWIIEGLSSYLALVVIDELENPSEFDIHSIMNIGQISFQNDFFRKALNSDSTSQVSSLEEKIELIDDDTLFDSLFTLKSTCLMRMIFVNKTFEYTQNFFQKLNEKIEKDEFLTFEIFYDAFNSIQCEPFFESYFKNQGHPIVVVKDDLKMHQTRFSASRNSQNFIWSIPLKITVLNVKEELNGIEFEVCETVSLLFDKKELNLNDYLHSVDEKKILIINHNSESFCRVWYKGAWMKKLCDFAEKLAKTEFESDLFNVFLDATALSDLGFVDRKLLESFEMFQIPPNLQRKFPRLIGSSTLSEYK